jgi:short-subunit dehydrogenase
MKQQNTVLITGATSGIGRHAALALAESGHRVIATGRKADALRQLRRDSGERVEIVELDVNRGDSIEAAKREVQRLTAGRGVYVLINNAGYGMAAPLIETTESDLRDQFETNVFGLMGVTRAFVPDMLLRGSGRVINISSVGGRVTFPFFGAYNATKYAVEALSDALRRELAPFGLYVALIEPGPIRTEFSGKAMEFVAKYQNASSPYAQVYDNAQRVSEQADARAIGPEAVVRAIVHAMAARRPRARYVVPARLHVFLALLSVLPTRWVDLLMQRFIGLPPKLPAAARSPRTLAA